MFLPRRSRAWLTDQYTGQSAAANSLYRHDQARSDPDWIARASGASKNARWLRTHIPRRATRHPSVAGTPRRAPSELADCFPGGGAQGWATYERGDSTVLFTETAVVGCAGRESTCARSTRAVHAPPRSTARSFARFRATLRS